MSIIRSIRCDMCGHTDVELVPDAGWAGWSAVHGVQLNGTRNPNLCPACTGEVMNFIDARAKEKSNGLD